MSSRALLLLALLSGSAFAAPQPRPALQPRAVAVRALRPVRASKPQAIAPLGKVELEQFTKTLIERERGFYRAGVAYDGETGMTFDGHSIDAKTGALAGTPRSWSAASKESLHIILLVKAIEGDATARAVLTPDPSDPEKAVPAAIAVLQKKIASYQKFDREYPGYGGFLPWYKVEDGKVTPTADWTDRVPGLDNGQLAWSLYHAADALERHGYHDLASQYGAHVDLMKRNVVGMFYDPVEHKMRAETKLVAGNGKAPAQNHYVNNQANYFLDDPYEGLLLCHFADLFGNWSKHEDGKERIWTEARRKPATYKKDGEKITVVEGNWFSSHEDWGFLVLPYRDLKVADTLFVNGQKARTAYSAKHGWPGLFASTSAPGKDGSAGYLSALGVPSIAKEKVIKDRVFAPYAAFPLALTDKPMFAAWMKRMLDTPGMWGENGMGESFRGDGKAIAPILTWDGKALPLVAMMGGIGDEIAAQLKREGHYDAFLSRVRADYSRFDGKTIEGTHLTISAPTK